MIQRKTTLILGAGGSFPYEFPLGEALKQNIVHQILYPHSDQRVHLRKNLLGQGFKQDQLQDFAMRLRRSSYMSVDAFLEEWTDDVALGKIAIAANLIDREMEDNLLGPNENGRWYHYLLNLLGNREEFLSNQLSIITFNYDRSFEYFLYFTLKSRFNLPESKIIEYVNSIPVIHVHGQLGAPLFLDSKGRGYENTLNYGVLETYSKSINIIHEDLSETASFQEARKVISQSEILIFIGFGYHQKNIERLKLKEHFKGEKVFCTFFKKGEGEIQRDMTVLTQNLPGGNDRIPIEPYIGDVLSFLKEKNELR